jgi:predicted enzyme related to lactoylglutathione lyase
MIVIDAPSDSHDQELSFWQAALGVTLRREEQHPEYHGAVLPHQQQHALLVQRLGSGAARVHLDIHTDDVDAEVARLTGLGAEPLDRVQGWCVMRDPAGLRFCVVPAPGGSLDDDNAQRWD